MQIRIHGVVCRRNAVYQVVINVSESSLESKGPNPNLKIKKSRQLEPRVLCVEGLEMTKLSDLNKGLKYYCRHFSKIHKNQNQSKLRSSGECINLCSREWTTPITLSIR